MIFVFFPQRERGHVEGYELTDGWHGNKVSSELAEILHPPDRQDLLADGLDNADTQMEMRCTVLVFCDYLAVIRTFCSLLPSLSKCLHTMYANLL